MVSWLRQEIDIILAIAGLVLGFALLLLCLILAKPLGLSLCLIISCGVYLILVSRYSSKSDNILIKGNNQNLLPKYATKYLLIFTFSLIFLSIFSFYFFLGSITRPLYYFVIASIIYAAISIEMYVFSDFLEDDLFVYNILVQIIALSSSIIFTGIFVLGPGSDQWFHEHLVNTIIYNGHVPQGNDVYFSYAFTHVGIAITRLITSLTDMRHCEAAFIAIFYILSVIFIFITGKLIFSTRASIYATFFFSMYVWHIYWGIFMLPMSLGISFIVMYIYFIFKEIMIKDLRFRLLFIYISLVINVLHPVSSIAILIISTILFLFIPFLSKINLISDNHFEIRLRYILLCLVATIGFWIFSATHFFESSLHLLVMEILRSVPPLQLNSEKALLNYEFDHLGENILYFLVITGSLCWIKHKKQNELKLITFFCGIPFILIAYASWIFGFETMLPHRWLIFGGIFISFPAYSGLQFLLSSMRKHNLFILFIIISVLSFSMIANTISNADGPIYGKNDTVRYQLMESELRSGNFAHDKSIQIIYMDWLLYFYEYQHFSDPSSKSDIKVLDEEYSDTDLYSTLTDKIVENMEDMKGLFIMRNYAYYQPVQRPYRLNSTILSNIRHKRINYIYCNGEASIYSHNS